MIFISIYDFLRVVKVPIKQGVLSRGAKQVVGVRRIEHHLGGVGKIAGDLIQVDLHIVAQLKRIEKRIPVIRIGEFKKHQALRAYRDPSVGMPCIIMLLFEGINITSVCKQRESKS